MELVCLGCLLFSAGIYITIGLNPMLNNMVHGTDLSRVLIVQRWHLYQHWSQSVSDRTDTLINPTEIEKKYTQGKKDIPKILLIYSDDLRLMFVPCEGSRRLDFSSSSPRFPLLT
jgi:hypothetical protein